MGTPRMPEALDHLGGFVYRTSALPMLARSHPLTGADWIELVDSRAEVLKRNFESMTLKSLEDVECLRSDGRYYDMKHNSPTVTARSNPSFNLQTQGIFDYVHGNRVNRGLKGHVHIWGMTRRNPTWILAKLEWKKEPGYKNRGFDRATRIRIWEASLSEIVEKAQVTHKEIWERLGEAIMDLAAHRWRLYENARDLAVAVAAEQKIFEEYTENILPKKFFWFCCDCKRRGLYLRSRREGAPSDTYIPSVFYRLHSQTSPGCSPISPLQIYGDTSAIPEEKRPELMAYRESPVV